MKSLPRGIKPEDSGKNFVAGATSLIIVIIVNFGTCPAGLCSYIRAPGPDVTHNYHRGHPPVTWRLQNAPLFMTGCSDRFEKGCNDRADSPNADAPQRLLRTLIKHALLRWRVNREDSSPSSLPSVSRCISPLAHLFYSTNWPIASKSAFSFLFRYIKMLHPKFCRIHKYCNVVHGTNITVFF